VVFPDVGKDGSGVGVDGAWNIIFPFGRVFPLDILAKVGLR